MGAAFRTRPDKSKRSGDGKARRNAKIPASSAQVGWQEESRCSRDREPGPQPNLPDRRHGCVRREARSVRAVLLPDAGGQRVGFRSRAASRCAPQERDDRAAQALHGDAGRRDLETSKEELQSVNEETRDGQRRAELQARDPRARHQRPQKPAREHADRHDLSRQHAAHQELHAGDLQSDRERLGPARHRHRHQAQL